MSAFACAYQLPLCFYGEQAVKEEVTKVRAETAAIESEVSTIHYYPHMPVFIQLHTLLECPDG